MSFAETVLLGAIAGFTIYLGLPVGRLGRVSDRARVALAMFSVGILAFIFIDVIGHGQRIVETALVSYKHNDTSLGARSRIVRAARPSASQPVPPASRRSSHACGGAPCVLRLRAGTRPTTLTADELARYEFNARRVALQTRDDDRVRDRPAQLRRRARYRRLGEGRRDRPCDRADRRLRSAQRDRGLRNRRPARQCASILAMAVPRGAGRRWTHVRRHDPRLPGALRPARAVLLRARRRRDHLRRSGRSGPACAATATARSASTSSLPASCSASPRI